jgi:serine/threonine protein phosphatase 1
MGRTFALSDLHGCYDLWEKVKEYLNEDDVLWYLGDAIDRGSDGLAILLELLRRKNTFFIKGNHEEFLERCVPELIVEGYSDEYSLWVSNGGKVTWELLSQAPEETQWAIVNKVKNLPTRCDITNKNGQTIILTHAGFNPFSFKLDFFNEEQLNTLYLWSRNHFDTKWQLDNEEYKNVYLVHGHTPVQIHNKNEVEVYGNGHMFNIDMGSIWSKKTVLFNLDTLQPEKYFTAIEKI